MGKRVEVAKAEEQIAEAEGWVALEKLRHEHKLIEIDAETKARKELEAIKFDNIMSHHRIKRSDRMKEFATKRDFQQYAT